ERLPHGEDPVARGVAARNHVDPPADVERIANDIVSGHRGSAGGREEERREDLDEGGFTGAVGAQESEAFAVLYPKVDALKGEDLALLPAGAEGSRERVGFDRRGRSAAAHLPKIPFSASRAFLSGSSAFVESVRVEPVRVVSFPVVS